MFLTAISGHLTEDAEMRYTPKGDPVTNIRLAYNTRYRDESGNWVNGAVTFFELRVWGAKAEAAAGLKRGEHVMASVKTTPPQLQAWTSQHGEAAAAMVFTAKNVARIIHPPKKSQ